MSIALDNDGSRSSRGLVIQDSGFVNGNEMSCVPIGDGNLEPDRRGGDNCDSSPSSSIGKNSDVSGGLSSEGEDSGGRTTTEEEVQSKYKGGGGGALDAMDALEEVLPIRRGISRFYNGKSKSFASLAYAASSSPPPSIQGIAKPENAYTRKRRNLLASSLGWDKNRSSPLRSNGTGAGAGAGGISKKFTNLSRTKLALAVAMSTCDSSDLRTDDDLNMSMNLISRSPMRPRALLDDRKSSLSPYLRRDFSTWRSFSLADLQCATVETNDKSGSSSSSDEHRSPY